jgi:hypothetical protein
VISAAIVMAACRRTARNNRRGDRRIALPAVFRSDRPTMKHIFVPFFLALLVGCTSRILNSDGSPMGPPVDTGSEAIHVVVPEGSKIGFQANRPGIQIVEYVPENQSVEHWTDMLTVLIMARDTASDIDAFFRRMTNTFHLGCEVEPIVEAPTRFLDGPYPAGIQTAICGKSKQFGSGTGVVYKMIQGVHGFYQVQRAWNFPSAVRSQDIPLTKAMRDSAAERLALVHLCDRQNPGQQC